MKMRYIMRGFTSVVRLPLFLIVVFTISAAAQEQPENNQAVQILAYAKTKPIPVYTGRELAEKFLTSTK